MLHADSVRNCRSRPGQAALTHAAPARRRLGGGRHETPESIQQTIKAGILEQATVDLLRQTGVGNPMMRDGFVHHGINLAFSGDCTGSTSTS
jgi:hypothetical protein